MLKITTVQENDNTRRIRLCGEFTSEYISELERSVNAASLPDVSVSLDMSNVTFVDREAMVFLCSARSRNISIDNVPSYVRRWIEQEKRCGGMSRKPCPDAE